MTSLPIGIIDAIESGDYVLYRDSAGRGVTLKEVITFKKSGTWENVRPSLYQPYAALPDVPYKMPKAPFQNRNVSASDLESALNTQLIPHETNNTAPRMQPLKPLTDPAIISGYENFFQSQSVVGDLLGDVPEQDLGQLLAQMFPQGLPDPTAAPTRVASFVQPPRNTGADATLYAATRSVLMSMVQGGVPADITDPLVKILSELKDIGATHFFGTGSPLGQVGRLAVGFRMKNLADRLRASSPLWAQVQDYDTFKAIMDSRRAVTPLPSEDALDILPSSLISSPSVRIVDVLEKRDIPVGMVHITITADAGLPWESNARKGDTIFGDIAILSRMHQEVTQMSTKGDVESFSKRWSWTTLHKLKAKAEVYHLEKFNTKIRNISVPSNSIMILPQMALKLVKWATSTYQRPIREGKNSSLMGYAPFHAGHDKLIRSILNSDGPSVLHYADNLYIFEGNKFASIDISSMEAIHTSKNILNTLRYFLERCFGCTYNSEGTLVDGGRLGNTNAWLIHHWFGNMVAKSKGILRSTIVEVPGLPSGMPGTFEFNDCLMAIAADAIEATEQRSHLTAQGLPRDHVVNIMKSLGMTIKVETHAPMPDSPPIQAALNRPWTPVAENPVFIKTDMLGMDTVAVNLKDFPPFYAPILNRERLMKAIAFNKADIRQEPHGPTTAAIIRLATLNILYLSGGWAHADVATAIEITARSMISEITITDAVSNLTDSSSAAAITATALAKAAATIDAENTIDESMARGLMRKMLGTGLIPLTDVFEIVHSQAAATALDATVMADIRIIGSKALRMLGPVIIADRGDQLAELDLDWLPGALASSKRALELLLPLVQPQEGVVTTSDVQTDGGPPPPEATPSTSATMAPLPRPSKRDRPVPSEDELPRALTTVPRMAGINDAEWVLDAMLVNWQLRGIPYLVPPVLLTGSEVRDLAAALSDLTDVPASQFLEHQDTLGRLITTGAVDMEPDPSPKRRRPLTQL